MGLRVLHAALNYKKVLSVTNRDEPVRLILGPSETHVIVNKEELE